MELSKRLWLPTKIVLPDSVSNSSSGFFERMESDSWFSSEMWSHETRNPNSSTIFYRSLPCSPADDMGVGVTESDREKSLAAKQKRPPKLPTIKKSPKTPRPRKPPTDEWVNARPFACEECDARYKRACDLSGHVKKKHSLVPKEKKPAVNAVRIFGIFVDPATRQHLRRLFGISRAMFNHGIDLCKRTGIYDAEWLMGLVGNEKNLPHPWMSVLPTQCRKPAVRDAAVAMAQAAKTGGNVEYRTKKTTTGVLEYENRYDEKNDRYQIRATRIANTKRYLLKLGDDKYRTLAKSAGQISATMLGPMQRHESRRTRKANRRKMSGKQRRTRRRKCPPPTPGLVISKSAAMFINEHCTRGPKIVMTRTGKFQIHVPFSAPETPMIPEDASRKVVALDPGVRTFLAGWSPDGTAFKLGTSGKDGGRGCSGELYRRILGACKLEGMAQTARGKERRKLRDRAARRRARIKNLVNELHYKTIRFLTSRYDVIVLPPFGVRSMGKRFEAAILKRRRIGKKTAGQMYALGHCMFRERLLKVSKRTGTAVWIMSEEYTTQMCGLCHSLNKNVGGSKTYRCVNPTCGASYDRDVGGGARNIFLKNVSL